jgi:biotin-dependent carboxylase-like uncharacterized protein
MAVEILEAGLSSTIQDLGRPHYYNVGIPPSGAADQFSAISANLLVGNPEEAAVIESPYMGPKIRFTQATVVAVTGATMPTTLNEQPVPQWESFAVAAGDELAFGFLSSGARVYIAVAGGFDVPSVLGSRSTYVLGGFGGFEGRTLRQGDVIATGATASGTVGRVVPERLRPIMSRNVELRVVLGPYDYRLTPAGLACLLDTEWKLTPVADRTGFRYSGPALEWVEREQPFGAGSDLSNIVDTGYPIGSIQAPGGGDPIILHRDAVSGGGYAMVATVISADMGVVAQSSPGARTRFRAVSFDEALEARGAARQVRAELRRSMD